MRAVITIITCDLCEAEVDSLGAGIELEVLAPTAVRLPMTRVRLDLCDAHVEELVTATKRFVDAGTRVAPAKRSITPAGANVTPSSSTARVTRRDPEQTTAIRSWAKANGYTIAERGRIPADIEKAYNFRSTSARIAS